jgi:hypothetical protein
MDERGSNKCYVEDKNTQLLFFTVVSISVFFRKASLHKKIYFLITWM